MTRKNNQFKLIRVKDSTHDLVARLKRELAAIEQRDLSMDNIIERGLSSKEIQERLRIGAEERRIKR